MSILDRRTVVGDLVRYVPSQFVPAIVSFVLIAILTRILSPAGYGGYTLLVTTVALVRTGANSWLHDATLRFYPSMEDDGQARRFSLSLCVYSACSTGVALVGLTAILVLLHSYLRIPLLGTAALAAAILLVADSALDLGQALLRAQRKVWAYAASTSVTATARLALCAAGGLLLADRISGVLIGRALGAVLVAAPTLVFALTTSRLTDGGALREMRASHHSVREFLAYGLPLSGSLLIALFLADADRFLLQALSGTEAVGVYSAIYMIASGSLTTLYPLVLMAAFPVLTRLWDRPGGQERVRELIRPVMRYFLLLAAPATAGIILLSHTILLTLTTPAYASHSAVMLPVALGIFFLGLAQYTSVGLALNKRTLTLTCILLGAAGVNLLLNILLIPHTGVLGAGIATLIGYAAYTLTGALVGGTYLSVPLPLSTALRSGGGCILMAVVLVPLQGYLPANLVSLAVLICLGAAVYGAALVVTGEVHIPVARAYRFVPWRPRL